MSFHIYREELLFEYLRIISEQQRHQSNAFLSYNRTLTSLHDAIRPVILRLFDQPTRSTAPPRTRLRPRYEPIRTNVNTQTNYFDETASAPARLTTNYINTPRTQSAGDGITYRLPRRRRPTLRVNRRNAITPTPTRNTIIQNLLETTLYSTSSLNPLTPQDISNNTITTRWIDISSNYNQEMCPISQELFRPNDTVMYTRECGHVFLENHLRTYLETYDYRCPVCRHDLRNSNTSSSSSTPTQRTYRWVSRGAVPTPQTMLRDISNQTSTFGIYDISNSSWPEHINTLPNTTNNNTNPTQFNNVVNAMSNALLSSLSNVLTNTDNSGNTIAAAAEYSLFLPRNNNSNNNSNNNTNNNTGSSP